MHRAVVGAALAVATSGPTPDGITAQQGTGDAAWFPSETYFELPAAAPREPRLQGWILSTDLLQPGKSGGERPPFDLDTDDRESQATAGLGATVRLLRLARWSSGGATLGFQAGVFGRFRLEGSANDLVATDWLVTLPVTARVGPWSGRFCIVHWSSHLGDEIIEQTGAPRADFTFEAVELTAARDLGPIRLYGGGSLVLRSQLEDAEDTPPGFTDDGSVQVGVDGGWFPWRGGTLGLSGGVDLQWADRTEWRNQLSALGALELRGAAGSFMVGVRYFDGPSPLGQFFLTEESAWGLEIRMKL